MDSTQSIICLWTIAIFWILEGVTGSGELTIKLIRYDNSEGKGDNGHCCDGRGNICNTLCDHMFGFCIDKLPSEQNVDTCALGKFETDKIPDQNVIDFSETNVAGVPNPLKVDFINYGAGFVFKVDVWDKDGWLNANDHVDFLYKELYPTTDTTQTISAEARTNLTFQVYITCHANYYGNKCQTFCKSSADSNYDCDRQSGNKICHAGWEGEDCNAPITTTTTPTTTTTTTTTTPSTTSSPRATFRTTTSSTASLAPFPTTPQPTESFPSMFSTCRRDGSGEWPVFHRGRTHRVLCYDNWVVFQQREDGSASFDRSWEDYKLGFGTLGRGKDFWFGLEKIHRLTNTSPCALKVVMYRMSYSPVPDVAVYRSFRVTSESDGYRLYVSDYDSSLGNAGDALTANEEGANINGMQFSTKDRDNDRWKGKCANRYNAGWWYNDCSFANPNGRYRGSHNFRPAMCPGQKCINWRTLPHFGSKSLYKVMLMIAPSGSL